MQNCKIKTFKHIALCMKVIPRFPLLQFVIIPHQACRLRLQISHICCYCVVPNEGPPPSKSSRFRALSLPTSSNKLSSEQIQRQLLPDKGRGPTRSAQRGPSLISAPRCCRDGGRNARSPLRRSFRYTARPASTKPKKELKPQIPFMLLFQKLYSILIFSEQRNLCIISLQYVITGVKVTLSCPLAQKLVTDYFSDILRDGVLR